MTTATTVSPVDEARAQPDPMRRLEEASALVERFKRRANQARSMRDMATVVAHLDDGVPPVTLYRDTLHCSRGLFVRIVQRAPAVRPRIDGALEEAAASAQAVRRNEALLEEARMVRDETAMLLMNGGIDPVTGKRVKPVPNAQVAQVTGLTSARVAQVRAGRR